MNQNNSKCLYCGKERIYSHHTEFHRTIYPTKIFEIYLCSYRANTSIRIKNKRIKKSRLNKICVIYDSEFEKISNFYFYCSCARTHMKYSKHLRKYERLKYGIPN